MGSPPGRAISRSFVGRDVLSRLRLRDRDRVPESGLVVGTHLAGDGPPPRPDLPHHPAELIALRGVSESLSQIFANFVNISTHILFLIVALLLLRFVLPQDLARGGHPRGVVRIHLFVWFRVSRHHPLDLCVVCGFLPVRLVSILVGTFTNDLLHGFPLTTDPTVWYAHAPILAVLVCMALAVYGFKVSLGGRPRVQRFASGDVTPPPWEGGHVVKVDFPKSRGRLATLAGHPSYEVRCPVPHHRSFCSPTMRFWWGAGVGFSFGRH